METLDDPLLPVTTAAALELSARTDPEARAMPRAATAAIVAWWVKRMRNTPYC
jgi:hypothetical protein